MLRDQQSLSRQSRLGISWWRCQHHARLAPSRTHLASLAAWHALRVCNVRGQRPPYLSVLPRLAKKTTSVRLGSVFGRTDFWRFFCLGRRIFLRIFSPDFFPSFLWGKRAQKNPPGKSPAKSSKNYTTKSPTHFCRGSGQKLHISTVQKCESGCFCDFEGQSSKPLKSWPNEPKKRLSAHPTVAKESACFSVVGRLWNRGSREPKVPPFLWAFPFSIKHPQDNFSLHNVN